MPDNFSKKKRSQIMSQVKSRETKLELHFRKMMKGLRFCYQPKIFGKPDFASKKLKIAIFIDSCFWHKCLKHFREPNSNISYWKSKINRNVERAKEVNALLKKEGWKVVHFWEHDVFKHSSKCIKKIKCIYAKKQNSNICLSKL